MGSTSLPTLQMPSLYSQPYQFGSNMTLPATDAVNSYVGRGAGEAVQPSIDTPDGGGSSFGAMGALNAAVGIGNLALGFQSLKAQKEAFEYNKKLSTNQFNATALQHNTVMQRHDDINNRLTARRKALGETDASYANQKRISSM